MSLPVNNLVIAGGGTAGWMTASYLKAAFGEKISITLVESQQVGTIGVGEATFSTIRHFFDFLQLQEEEWMPACHATYKLAVRFEDWHAPNHYFYHPFEQVRTVDGFPLTDWWLRMAPSDRFDQDCFIIAALCDACSSPRHSDGTLFEQEYEEDGKADRDVTLSEHQGRRQFPYAYHLDAALLAKYLTKYATDRGVQHIVDDIKEVGLDENGWISHLETARNGPISGDLFVDCTGFRSLLLRQTLGEQFISFQNFLPNDRAVALRVPLGESDRDFRPCTTATAREAGWIWTIPLLTRIGTGYVYSSEYCEPELAEQTLREFLGSRADDIEANHIRMKIGRSRDSWVKNCVAVGLSSGFVEPLESTGIFFIHHAIAQLVKYFPADGHDAKMRALHNREVAHVIDGVMEFLVLHYTSAARNDSPYWQDAKTRPISDHLVERLEQWRVRLPDFETIYPHYHGFAPYSYMCILMGMGRETLRPSPALAKMDSHRAQAEFRAVQERGEELAASLPSQREYLTRFR